MAIVMSRLVPAVALTTPFYLLIQAMGLLGTKTALVLVHSVLTLPFTVLILSVFFRRIPQDIEDAASIDGCTRVQVFTRVVIPLSLPSLAATGLFAFMLSYAEFLFALVLSGEASNRPLAVVMASLARNADVSWGLSEQQHLPRGAAVARAGGDRLAPGRRGHSGRRRQRLTPQHFISAAWRYLDRIRAASSRCHPRRIRCAPRLQAIGVAKPCDQSARQRPRSWRGSPPDRRRPSCPP